MGTYPDSNIFLSYFHSHHTGRLPGFLPIFHATFFQLPYGYKGFLTFFRPPVFYMVTTHT